MKERKKEKRTTKIQRSGRRKNTQKEKHVAKIKKYTSKNKYIRTNRKKVMDGIGDMN